MFEAMGAPVGSGEETLPIHSLEELLKEGEVFKPYLP